MSRRDRMLVGLGVLLPLGVAAALVPVRTSFSNAGGALALVAVVVFVAAYGHRLAGMVAAVSAAAWFDFFLTEPYDRFAITHRADIETTLLLVAVGVAVTELAVRGRRARTLARTDEVYLDAIASTNNILASSAAPAAVIDLFCAHITTMLDLRGCRFERGRYGGMPRLQEDGSIGGWDIDQLGMPDTEVELLCVTDSVAQGRFVLDPTPGELPPLLARRLSSVLAAQLATARFHQARAA